MRTAPVLNHPAVAVVADALPRRQRCGRRREGEEGAERGLYHSRAGTHGQDPEAAGNFVLPLPHLERHTTLLPPPAPPGCRSWCARHSPLPDASCVSSTCTAHFLYLAARPPAGVVELTRSLPPTPPEPPLFPHPSPRPACCALHTVRLQTCGACRGPTETPPRRGWWSGRARTSTPPHAGRNGACKPVVAWRGRRRRSACVVCVSSVRCAFGALLSDPI